MENENLKPIEKLTPFTKMIMTIGTLPSSFYASMSYYESMVWLYEYLKNVVIPVVNNNSEVTEELQTAFIQLENYIEHYFENLDIQEEVNAKLDEMAEDGTLADLVAEYVKMQGQLVYNTVADMKSAENIQNGSFLKTYGFYNINDGGNAYYKARTVTNEDVIDEITIIALHDPTLVAELIIENQMAVECFGAKGDNATDDSDSIQLAVNKAQNIIFSKIYKTTKQINITKPCYLKGIKENKINSSLTGTISVFKLSSSHITFENLNIELTYAGGGTTGEHGNTISIGTYYMTASNGIEDINIRACNIKRTGTLSYNIGIFGDSHDILIENCKLYGECVNLHWGGDFNPSAPDTSACTKTYHPYNVIVQNNILENNRGVFISGAYNVKILNNTFINNTNPITLSIGDYGNTLALDEQKNAILTGIDIENCNFYEYTNQAIIGTGYGYREDDLEHQKNYLTTSKVVIKNCCFNDTTQNVATAILSSTLFYNMTIENCLFKSTRQNAIYTLCSFNSIIKNCTFEVAGTPITFFGNNNSIIEHCNGQIASGYNFIRTTNYTFTFTGLTYNVENLTIKNNIASGRTTLLNINYTRNLNILENNFYDFNKALLFTTDNKNINVINNVLNEGSLTSEASHYCVDLGNTDNANFMNNYLNGARGIVIKATATNVKLVNNAMIGNPFSGGLLCAIDSRTNKDVYIQGSITDSNASSVYGNYYSYLQYTEIS